MSEWLDDTHGANFELLRHFVHRFFDSELTTTPDQWKMPVIWTCALFGPWFPLFADPLGHALIVGGITLQTIGYFYIRRIIRIQV